MATDLVAYAIYPDRATFESALQALRDAGDAEGRQPALPSRAGGSAFVQEWSTGRTSSA